MVVRLDGASGLDDGAGGPATLVGQTAAKCWAAYNQTGPTVNDSLNVSSITDSASGNFTVNASSNFANINFAGTCQGGNGASGGYLGIPSFDAAPTVSAFHCFTESTGGTDTDLPYSYTTQFGDLA
jgi:hypothetical protein